jgi:hypothetical protein
MIARRKYFNPESTDLDCDSVFAVHLLRIRRENPLNKEHRATAREIARKHLEAGDALLV